MGRTRTVPKATQHSSSARVSGSGRLPAAARSSNRATTPVTTSTVGRMRARALRPLRRPHESAAQSARPVCCTSTSTAGHAGLGPPVRCENVGEARRRLHPRAMARRAEGGVRSWMARSLLCLLGSQRGGHRQSTGARLCHHQLQDGRALTRLAGAQSGRRHLAPSPLRRRGRCCRPRTPVTATRRAPSSRRRTAAQRQHRSRRGRSARPRPTLRSSPSSRAAATAGAQPSPFCRLLQSQRPGRSASPRRWRPFLRLSRTPRCSARWRC